VKNELVAFTRVIPTTPAILLQKLFKSTEGPAKDGHQVVNDGTIAGFGSLPQASVRRGIPLRPDETSWNCSGANCPNTGGHSFIQCEDEIASVSDVPWARVMPGASRSRAPAVRAFLSKWSGRWGVMAEVRCGVVMFNAAGVHRFADQRRNNSDLNIAASAATAIRPRRAARPTSRMFYTAIEAVNIGAQIQRPGFILSDQAIATALRRFPSRTSKSLPDISPDLSPVPDFHAVDLSAPDGVVPRVVPGHAHRQRQISRCDRPRTQ